MIVLTRFLADSINIKNKLNNLVFLFSGWLVGWVPMHIGNETRRLAIGYMVVAMAINPPFASSECVCAASVSLLGTFKVARVGDGLANWLAVGTVLAIRFVCVPAAVLGARRPSVVAGITVAAAHARK